ncbi:hypothetical protein ACN47A_18810 [Myxococcus fulvus]|uniref:hypothetical protein n=1 Tax=Myxococcus fulvus TaxID=33 RepID=UPI003B9AE906
MASPCPSTVSVRATGVAAKAVSKAAPGAARNSCTRRYVRRMKRSEHGGMEAAVVYE